MERKKRIKLILAKQLPNWILEIYDISNLHAGHNNFDGFSETHFRIILNSKGNNNESKLKIHRKINNLPFHHT